MSLIGNLGPVIASNVFTFHWNKVDAQTRDRILCDVAESGGFTALTPVYAGQSPQVLPLRYSLLIFRLIHH